MSRFVTVPGMRLDAQLFSYWPPNNRTPPRSRPRPGNGGCCFKAVCYLRDTNKGDDGDDAVAKFIGYDVNPVRVIRTTEEACSLRQTGWQVCSEPELIILRQSPRPCCGELYFTLLDTGTTERLV